MGSLGDVNIPSEDQIYEVEDGKRIIRDIGKQLEDNQKGGIMESRVLQVFFVSCPYTLYLIVLKRDVIFLLLGDTF